MRLSLTLLVSAVAGALTPLGLAPYSFWLLPVLSLTLLAAVLHRGNFKHCLVHSLAFGLGYYGMGVSWVYISIHEYGNAPAPLAALMTFLFVAFLAFVFSLPLSLIHWVKNKNLRLLIAFPLLWGLGEWSRSWLLTGFPWLYIGYGHLSSPLVGWAPIGGVLLVGLLSALSSAILAFTLLFRRYLPLLAMGLVGLWGLSVPLKSIEWTTQGESIQVGMVQPNVSLLEKWNPEYRQPIADKLWQLSDPLWQQVDWLIWPEAAIPDLYFRSTDYIAALDQQAKQSNTHFVSGILYDNEAEGTYFNSVIGAGLAEGIYFKQRLVPFGEYVPLESWLRGLIDFFNLPNSFIQAGPQEQENLTLGDYKLATSICYEIVYPSLVAQQLKNAHAILTISNDSWFGESIGPLQHFHMARMRAIETGRFVIRVTNNGVSGIISPKGIITQRSEQFIATTAQGEIKMVTGNTPYLIWQDNLFLGLLALAAVFVALRQYRDSKPHKGQAL